MTILGSQIEYGSFEAHLMAILARAVVLSRAGHDSDAQAALMTATALAETKAWQLNPLPEFDWLNARWAPGASN